MKKIITLSTFITIVLSSFSQVWTERDSLPAPFDMAGGFSFSIDGKLYMGGGSNGTNWFSGFYQYDPVSNTWATMADIPETVEGTYGFALNGKGYVACGYNGTSTTTNVYMYDPGTNTWTQKNNFPGGPRENNVCFSAKSYGYLFGGLPGGAANDLWQYNDSTDTWLQMLSCPGPGRDGPVFLVINSQIYLGMGGSSDGTQYYPDFYRFDPDSNTYRQVDSMPAPRGSASQFSLGNVGYVGLGRIVNTNTFLSDFYIFDPVANTWTQTDSFGGGARSGANSETVNGVPYIATGVTYNTTFFRDCWSFGSPSGVHTVGNNAALSCYPSPTMGSFTIDMTGYNGADRQINICDQLGQSVYRAESSQDRIQIGNILSPGFYFISVIQNGKQAYARIVIE